MSNKLESPVTLRGHKFGVTALAEHHIVGRTYLFSGDEEGSVISWDLSTYRKINLFEKQCSSRIQSLRVIHIEVGSSLKPVLVIQSRDNGIQIVDIDPLVTTSIPNLRRLTSLASYPTWEAMFSRGDAVTIDDNQAILAYPSCVEDNLVTVRVIGKDAKTLMSGTAQRTNSQTQKAFKVFDICVRKISTEQYLLFVAYEDGNLCIFQTHPLSTTTVPVLNATGLSIILLKTYDLGIKDFISTLDVRIINSNEYIAICGSPINKLNIVIDKLDSVDKSVSHEINLKSAGVSVVKMRPDHKLIAMAGWDRRIRVFSIKSLKPLAVLHHHAKQVQDIIFIKTQDPMVGGDDKNFICCASLEGTISISSLY